MKLILASGNKNKVKEIETLIPSFIKLIGLKEIGVHDDIPETSDTIEGNAIQKANYIYQKFGYDCLSDDSGLEVNALNGAPGVYSARYAGEAKNDAANNLKLLKALEGQPDRSAQFKTFMALILRGKVYTFEGTIKGHIIEELRGDSGFGYDPLFIPDGYTTTFAQMEIEVKKQISHRAQALKKVIEFLSNYTE